MKPLWRDELDVRSNLQQRLPKLARKYLRAGCNALDGEKSWDELHQFRLATKRFRYTLELFRTQYGPGLEVMLEKLRHVQKLLGEANDSIVTNGLLQDIPGMDEIRVNLDSRADNRIKKLRAWWRQNLHPSAAQDQWIRYLGRYAGRPQAQRATSASPVRIKSAS